MVASTATSAGEHETRLTLLHGYCGLLGLLRLAAFVRDTRSPCICAGHTQPLHSHAPPVQVAGDDC